MKQWECGARMRGKRPGITTFMAGAVAVSALALSGCTGPTYGTGKPTEQQLMEDLTGILSLGPREKQQIDYSPRPGLVKPPSMEVLPPPQESVAASQNPAWPESPEQRLARIRAEATANQDNPLYRPEIVRDVEPSGRQQAEFVMEPSRQLLVPSSSANSKAQREELLRRRQEASQGSATTRRYLSDPPVELRQPVPTAPAGELGEDEADKKRAARQAAGETGGLRKLIPWL